MNVLKKLLIVPGVLAATVACYADGVKTNSSSGSFSQSFFKTQTPWGPASAGRVSIFRPQMRVDGWRGHAQVSVIGGQTTAPWELATYFLPTGNNKIRVIESKQGVCTTDGLYTKDVEARHFNIETASTDTTYVGEVCFTPQQTIVGAAFDYWHALSCDEDGNERWWIEVSAPLFHVRNTMGVHEKIIDDGGGAAPIIGLDNSPRVGTMSKAFEQKNWQYGKINVGHDLTKTALAQIELRVVRKGIIRDSFSQYSYAGFVIPTGNKPTAEYLFEPVVGDNRHAAFFWGSAIIYDMWCMDGHMLRMKIDFANRYGFSNTQRRSFDVRGKPWSRYMEVYRNYEEAVDAFVTNNPNLGTSGINVFTQCVWVSPRFSTTVNTAFLYSYGNFEIEAGFNFFARQGELIELCAWNKSPAFKAFNGEGATTAARTIKDNFNGSVFDLQHYHPISQDDLNLDSAAQPAAMNNAIYASCGYRWDCAQEYPSIVVIGGSYEFSHNNAAMNRWLLWGKAGLSF